MAQGNIRGCFPRHIRGWDNIRGQDTAPGERRDELSLAMWEPSRWFAGNLGFSWDISVLCLEIMERKGRGPALPRSTWRGWMGSSGSIRNQDPAGSRIKQNAESSRNQDQTELRIQQESGSRICNQGKALHGNGAAGIPSGAEPQLREGSPKDLGPSGPSTSLDLPGSLEVPRPWTWVILRVPSNPTIPYTRCQPGKAGFSRSRIPLFPG